MASITASLLILLSIASPMLTISQELPEVFPSELAQGTHIQAVLEKIKRFCPPFGNSDERFSVTVLGTKSPAIGGCVSMVPPNPDILPSFNLWLGNHKAGGGGKCGDKNMDHFLFECMTKNPLLTDEDTLKGWYVMLYDRTARWSERQDYRCALYETVKEDPPMIKMVISANQSCHGLLKKIKAPEYTVPKGLRHFSDGSIALQISKDLPQKPIWRKKRSEVRGGGCRFPDWSQGSWTDLQVDGSLVRYDSVHHEKDDVDYGQESDYGKEGDVETTGGQQYMQMSQRQKRDLWREPKTKIIEYFRDMQFKTPPKKRVPMEQFSKTNKYHGTTHSPANSIRKKRSTNEDLDEKYNSTEGNDATSVKNTDNLDDFVFNDLIHQWNILQTLPMVTNHSWEQFKRDTADFKKISYYVPFISDQIRKTKDLSKQHNHSEKNPNNEKTKCYCHHNVKDFTPLNDRDQIEIVNKVNKYFPTTKKYSEDLNQKSNFLFDSIQFQKKRQLDVEQDRIEDYLNLSDELKGIERGELTNVEKISQKYPDSLNKSASVPSKIVQRKKREVKHLFNFGEEDINNNKKKCYCYNDFEVFKLLKIFDEMNKYLANTQKHPLNLNKKSNFPFDFDQLHEKKELGNQYIHTKNDTKHRQKRCWGTPAKTTTERYRDAQFENPKRGDPTEPSSKPNEHFGTTQNPADLIRKRRFINEDLNYESESTEDDEEAALRNIKMKDNFNRYMRWRNIVNAISMIKNSIGTSEEKINKNEFEVFPENAPLPPPITYFKFAEIQGIPYREALINWRSLERAYLQKEAEIAYTAYPGQNHPDIVIKDFDQTFDGIEYDFNPLYPEGTDEDPTAYRALTLPDGYHIKPRLSRRATYEQKQLSGASNSATVVSHFQVVGSNPSNYRTNQENTPSLNQRLKRSSKQQNQQQRTTTKFSWSCEMPVVNDEKYLKHPENGVKFLTYGGRIVENNVQTGNDQHNENYSKNTYSCLWLVPRGPNILEYSIIATGMPSNNQSIHTFARQLCSKTRANGKDTGVRNENTLQSRRPSWVTVTRITQEKLVPTRCPVSPGVVFYGVVPAPPPPSTVATNKVQAAPLRLCARLVSSADDCATGQMGPADQMKYTVSECVDQDSSTGTAQTVIAAQTIFEEREYQCLGQWTEPQQQISPEAGEKSIMLTYTYVKRLNPITKEGAQYECFVGTPIPNDEGLNPETTTTILLTEAGTNSKCSRLSDPYRSGMKLVGTKVKKEGACKGSTEQSQDTGGGLWYSLKPQQISPSIPDADNGRGAWYAAHPVPVVAQAPTTMMPILKGRNTGGNGATFTSRQNEQTRRPTAKTNHSIRTVVDKTIIILLAVILITGQIDSIVLHFFN